MDSDEAPFALDEALIVGLIKDLSKSGEQPASALKYLFTVSQDPTNLSARVDLVRTADRTLVPALLSFLQSCKLSSNEMSTALLVLNNLSVPEENKRLIALENNGAAVLCELLCQDPSLYLVAIVLVNLTFADAELRRDLVDQKSHIYLLESLAYAMLVSSTTPEEYDLLKPAIHPLHEKEPQCTPKELLSCFLKEDDQLRRNDFNYARSRDSWFHPDRVLHAPTLRWTLGAMKNLTRPSKYAEITHALINTGVLPCVLKLVTTVSSGNVPLCDPQQNDILDFGDELDTSETTTPTLLHTSSPSGNNTPVQWHSQTAQDSALFLVVNLAAVPSAREYVREIGAVELLSRITSSDCQSVDDPTIQDIEVLHFQRIKARMALAYLVGSEGYFGQPRCKVETVVPGNQKSSVLLLDGTEMTLLVELLANALHRRPKDGPGGYSATTFNSKYVLFALRCLLTNDVNQTRFATMQGLVMNALLMKVLAQHALLDVPCIDPEAAEHAVFSLYLLSNYGFDVRHRICLAEVYFVSAPRNQISYIFYFIISMVCMTQEPFLPSSFGDAKNISNGIAAKILVAYHDKADITPAGKHAAAQLILRLKFLLFDGSAAILDSGKTTSSPSAANSCTTMSTISTKSSQPEIQSHTDYLLGPEIIQAADGVITGTLRFGARPRDDIFRRKVLRCDPPRKGQTFVAPWANHESVDTFASALIAAQDFSYNSLKVRHVDAIDDVQIANNIAKSANGEKTESYNYMWSWQDTAGAIHRSLQRQNSVASSGQHRSNPLQALSPDSLGFVRLCGVDTSVE